MPEKPAFYFPQADANVPALTGPGTGPPGLPAAINQVFSPELTSQPLKPFDTSMVESCFPQSHTKSSSASSLSPPPQPFSFTDPYLFPTLARNERERLTQLWYYTRNLKQDSELLARLQDKLNFVTEFIGWSFTIMGILDNQAYYRIATSGVPLAVLPRRESTCAHTINVAEKVRRYLSSGPRRIVDLCSRY